MSLENVPKIDWTTVDGVANTDLNNIGKNLNELEDSKYESGDSPTFGTVTAATATISSATLTTVAATTGNIATVNSTTVNSTNINNSGYVKSNFKSADGSVGINESFVNGRHRCVYKDGLLVSRTHIPD